MEAAFFIICDEAYVKEGKLYIEGSYEVQITQELPTVIPKCYFSGRIRHHVSEMGMETPLTIEIKDPGGKKIFEVHGTVPPFQPIAGSASTTFCLQINNLSFPTFGTYTINLLTKTKKLMEIPFFVVDVTKMVPPVVLSMN